MRDFLEKTYRLSRRVLLGSLLFRGTVWTVQQLMEYVQEVADAWTWVMVSPVGEFITPYLNQLQQNPKGMTAWETAWSWLGWKGWVLFFLLGFLYSKWHRMELMASGLFNQLVSLCFLLHGAYKSVKSLLERSKVPCVSIENRTYIRVMDITQQKEYLLDIGAMQTCKMPQYDKICFVLEGEQVNLFANDVLKKTLSKGEVFSFHIGNNAYQLRIL